MCKLVCVFERVCLCGRERERADRQSVRQKDEEINRQIDGRMYRNTNKQKDRRADKKCQWDRGSVQPVPAGPAGAPPKII